MQKAQRQADACRDKALRSWRPLRFNRAALTLIELLVVIVILTTLVAGVIPILSPNNDARKIREASRGLQTYITAAQAEAARTGRAHGIALRESAPGSGVALEVFHLGVPEGFAGFSSESRVRVVVPMSPSRYGPTGSPYNISDGNDRMQFEQYYGDQLYLLHFVSLGGDIDPLPIDPLPPRMFRVGDVVNVEGNHFFVVDDIRNREFQFGPSNVSYLDPLQHPNPYTNALVCVWLNSTGQVLKSPTVAQQYQFVRQPMPTSESPYQLPAGIVIDLQGSVVEGGSTQGLPVPDSFDTPLDTTLINPPLDTVGILFSSTGSVSHVYHNGSQVANISRIVLLLGRIENGSLQYDQLNASSSSPINVDDVTGGEWMMEEAGPEALAEKQETINWLNLDSRWLSIAIRSGRVIVNENAFVDPMNPAQVNSELSDAWQARAQIEAAHGYAHAMKREGGG